MPSREPCTLHDLFMRIHTKENTTSPEDTPSSSTVVCYGRLVERVTHFRSVPVEKTLAIDRLSMFDERKKSLISQKKKKWIQKKNFA